MATFENRLSRRKGKHGDEVYRLDTKNKTPEENIIEIIQGLYLKKSFHPDTSPTNKNVPTDFKPGFRSMQKSNSDSLRMSYLNALVMLLRKEERSDLGFTTDELMVCLRVSLVDQSMVIRAAALRVLRYLLKTESDVATFNVMKLPYLVVRSMDLMLRNEEERAQALRVVRRIIAVVGAVDQGQSRHRSAYIDQGLLRCLASVARAGSAGDGTGDRLSRPAIATLAEICVLNPDLFISCGGVTAVTRQLAECATPRMAEALCGVLLHTFNDPNPRNAARIDLTCLSSPYCDFHFRPAGTDSSRDEREMRFTCSRLALLCVLRSWPGLLHFCHPQAPGGLRALVHALYLPRLEVRKAILDLLYELVGLPQPEWTDEISVALGAVDPSDFQDSFRLNEGFVAAEGISILPHLSATGLDIIEVHLALLLQCFLEAGLLDGLAEVIVTSDTFISVRATVLLGQLLHLVNSLLPPPLSALSPALPTLLGVAAAGKPAALAAVAALRRLHATMEARPAANSLFLDHVIQYCSGVFVTRDNASKSRKERDNASVASPKTDVLYKDNSIEFLNESDGEYEPKQRHSVGSRADLASRNVSALVKSRSVSSRTSAAVRKVTKTKFFNLFERESDTLLKSSLVMQNKDGNTWNWEIIRTILKETDSAPLLDLNDSGHRAWAARIMNYLRPSANKYSHTDLSSSGHGHAATRAGCQLIRHLLRHNDLDSQKLLEDFFTDVSRQIEAIETGRKAHECLFSPQHMCTTMCQMYFLFVGQLCHSYTGLRMFKSTRLYENLLELSTKTHHSCYVKLVISSLDYTLDACPRDILAKTMTCNIQASRLYATQFLNVLLRASRKSIELIRKKSKLKKNIEPWRQQDMGENSVDMDTWLLQMLIVQIKDESKAVVKCALTILEEAFSVPVLFDKLMTMRDTLGQNCRLDRSMEPSNIDWSVAGDRGYLLWLTLEITAAIQSTDATSSTFVKKHLDFWNKFYNYRYVRLVDAALHEALAAGAGGRRSRARRSARPPAHLHAALAAALPPSQPSQLASQTASHSASHSSQSASHSSHLSHTPASHAPLPRARLHLMTALPPHYKVLQKKKCSNEQEIANLKASLWAIGSTAVTPQGLQLLMTLSNGFLEDSAPVHIVRLVKYCPVYSVRATAFYVLGLIGSTYDGANLLAELGWLCVRHTRHEQFPVIPDENYTQVMDPTDTAHYYITSPDRRYNAFDIDLSEQSDHTDQSTAESLHSESTKLNKTIGPISLEIENQDVVDHKLGLREPSRKSHTLPTQGCSTSQERSLTESRTVDILRDVTSYDRSGHRMNLENRLLPARMNSLEHAHEGRVRNTSESSTSGVSSCDSFVGKYAIPDRVLTLSPIPSSSSLYGMKASASTHRQRLESHRRTSTSSFNPEVANSPPATLDMSGYATLHSFNKHRRPHLSESAATEDDLSWLLTDTNSRAKPFLSLRDRSKSTRERMAKMSLFEYDWQQVRCEAGSTELPPPTPAPPAPPPTTHYVGVCLPRDLMDLFPREEDVKPNDTKDSTLVQTRVPSFLADSIVISDKSQNPAVTTSAIINISKIDHGITRIIETKAELPTHIEKESDELASLTKVTVDLRIEEKKEKDDDVRLRSEEGISDGSGSVGGATFTHSPSTCLACVRARPPSAHELRQAFLSGSSGVSRETTAIHSQLLNHVLFMANPIHLRQTRSALLSLKQRHPDAFRSACVYSDVCALLARGTYMLCARRFLQELFLDTSFECFASEPAAVLARHATPRSSRAPLSPLPPTVEAT